MGAVVRRWLALAVFGLAVACSKGSHDEPVARPSAVASAAPKPYDTPRTDHLGTLPPGIGVAVGSAAPDGATRDLHGTTVTLSSLWAKKPLLLMFYRGGWCPYCNFQIHALATSFAEFDKRGILPVAISVDRPEVEAETNATYEIPFPVLSDGDATVIEAFHVAKRVEPGDVAAMKARGVDLEVQSGKTHHVIAIPALFLVDRHGVVRWAHADPDFKVRPSPAQILKAIDDAGIETGK